MAHYSITGHMVVKNEARWIWFSIMSIIDFVDQLLIVDTGSTDQTVQIIELIMQNKRYANKMVFDKKQGVNEDNFYMVRQEQIDRTKTDYFFVIDGDEIWYKSVLAEVESILNQKDAPELLAVRFINCAGDMFHYRNFDREHYSINGIIGSITIRIYSMRINGIKCGGRYGIEGYMDAHDVPVQNGKWAIKTLDGNYLHMSMLQRAGKMTCDLSIRYRRKKFRCDWDRRFDVDFKYPEVLYIQRPAMVFNPWTYKIGIVDYVFWFLRWVRKRLLV